jgi:hypothetical protein
LISILPRLLESGSAGIVWPRLEAAAGNLGELERPLVYNYLAQVAHNALVETEIARAVTRLRDAGIECVLVKGWAISRLYPTSVVRPAGDIDLWVPPDDSERATAVLFNDAADPLRIPVDLQFQVPHVATKWVSVSQDELARSTERIEVKGVYVRVPRLDDHLRMLCFHLLGHGALRPMWLCDIALLMESRGADFDWNRLLGADARLRERVIISLLLAHELLGARIEDTPLAAHVRTLPSWLIPAVLDQWAQGEPDPTETSTAETGAFWQFAQNPHQAVDILRRRFPDPIRATVWRNAPFNDFPRWPHQWSSFVIRSTQYTRWRLAEQVRSALGQSALRVSKDRQSS